MDNLVAFKKNKINWTIKENYSKKIVGFLEESVDNTNIHVTMIKSNRVREVKFVPIGDQVKLYFKHYKTRKFLDIFKNFFIGSKAKKEWVNATEILKRGVSAGEPIAFGEKRSAGITTDNFLLVKAVENSISLQELLSNKLFKERTVIFKCLSLFIHNLHINGIEHNDLHTGNILIPLNIIESLKTDQTITAETIANSFCLIDLHDVKCKNSLSNSSKLKNLSFLLYSLTFCCTWTEIETVIDEYLLIEIDDLKTSKYSKLIHSEISSIQRRHMSSRTKRCLKNSTRFSVEKWKYRKNEIIAEGDYKVCRNKEYDKKALETAITKHYSAVNTNPDSIIKNSSRIHITAIPVDNIQDRSEEKKNGKTKICVKEFKNHNLLKQIRETVCLSKSRKSWHAANGFVVRKHPTPFPIAMVERRVSGLVKSSFLITMYIDNAIPSYIYVNEHLNADSRGTRDHYLSKKIFIESFASSLRKIHKSNIYHADLKGGNILVKETGENMWSFFFVDLDRVFFKSKLPMYNIIQNLTQLNASLPNSFSYTDRIRFFKSYSEKDTLSTTDKPIINKIIRASIRRNHFWKPTVK